MIPQASKFDPAAHRLIREWCDENDRDIADTLSYLGHNKVAIAWVENPFADALSRPVPHGRDYSESYSPVVRALAKPDWHWLDDYAAWRGPVPMSRDIRVTFRPQGDGRYAVSYLDPGISDPGVNWWIQRPARIAMKGRSMSVKASDFDFPPPIVLHGNTLDVYGSAKVASDPITINGVKLLFSETADSGRSKLPGGFKWGKFSAKVSDDGIRQLLGG